MHATVMPAPTSTPDAASRRAAAALDVLVVGAGPSGLLATIELLRRGLSVRLIDKATSPSPLSRAIGVQARTLELLEPLGVANELVEQGVRLRGGTIWSGGAPIFSVDLDHLDTRYPFILSLAQAKTEDVLTRALERHGGTIERGTELVELAQNGGRVLARVRGPDGDEQIEAAWAIGCDGAHSAVRKAIGLAFTGHSYEETFLVGDIAARWDVPRDRASVFLANTGVVAAFPMRSSRLRVVLTADGASTEGPPTGPELAAILEARSGLAIALDDAVGLGAFRIHSRQVERYRVDRIFVAGDAAHIHSPVGGQGMNTGMQDAHNLAWKLALVHRGRARPVLLDSYDAERRPIARRVLRATDFATRLGILDSGVARGLRNTAGRVASRIDWLRRRVAHEMSELSVDYRSGPLTSDRRPWPGSSRRPAAGDRVPPAMAERADPSSLTVLSIGRGEAAPAGLVDVATQFGVAVAHDASPSDGNAEGIFVLRPDGYVAFCCGPTDVDALDRYLDGVLVRATRR